MLSGGVGTRVASTTGPFLPPFSILPSVLKWTSVTRVCLRSVPVRVAQRRDRPGVVEERVRVPRRGREPELVADVVLAVSVVVDLDLVEHGVVEAREVRPAGRSFERDVVGNDVDLARVVRIHERVQVGVVSPWVLADQWRLRVTRGACVDGPWPANIAAMAAIATAATRPNSANPLLICAPFHNVEVAGLVAACSSIRQRRFDCARCALIRPERPSGRVSNR